MLPKILIIINSICQMLVSPANSLVMSPVALLAAGTAIPLVWLSVTIILVAGCNYKSAWFSAHHFGQSLRTFQNILVFVMNLVSIAHCRYHCMIHHQSSWIRPGSLSFKWSKPSWTRPGLLTSILSASHVVIQMIKPNRDHQSSWTRPGLLTTSTDGKLSQLPFHPDARRVPAYSHHHMFGIGVFIVLNQCHPNAHMCR